MQQNSVSLVFIDKYLHYIVAMIQQNQTSPSHTSLIIYLFGGILNQFQLWFHVLKCSNFLREGSFVFFIFTSLIKSAKIDKLFRDYFRTF